MLVACFVALGWVVDGSGNDLSKILGLWACPRKNADQEQLMQPRSQEFLVQHTGELRSMLEAALQGWRDRDNGALEVLEVLGLLREHILDLGQVSDGAQDLLRPEFQTMVFTPNSLRGFFSPATTIGHTREQWNHVYFTQTLHDLGPAGVEELDSCLGRMALIPILELHQLGGTLNSVARAMPTLRELQLTDLQRQAQAEYRRRKVIQFVAFVIFLAGLFGMVDQLAVMLMPCNADQSCLG